MIIRSSTLRARWALGCSAAAILGLAACGGPPAPEPMGAPPPPEQDAYAEADFDEGDDFIADDEVATEDGKPPEGEDVALDAEEEAYAEAPPEVVSMAPIPNPSDRDRYGRRRPEGERDVAMLEPYPADARPVDFGEREKPPESGAGAVIADAADPSSSAPGPYAMAPIPNPPEARRSPVAEGLMGAPQAGDAPAASPAEAAVPTARADGPSVRVPIQPARQAAAAPALRGAQAADRPAAEVRSLDDRVAAAATDLRRSVEADAVLEAPEAWAAGQTREVRLRFPEGFAERLQRAAADLGGQDAVAGEVSATLSGEGFRIDPAGPQAVTAAGTGQPLVWRVTPESANPGRLRAEVQAVTPAGTDRRTLSLGEVGPAEERRGLSASTVGWVLLVLLAGAFIAWLASRRPDGDDAAGRNRRRARAEQTRRERPAPLDLSPAPVTAGPGPDAR